MVRLLSDGIAIDTSELQTNVLVDDGETVVLGGIFDDVKRNDYEKVPFLS